MSSLTYISPLLLSRLFVILCYGICCITFWAGVILKTYSPIFNNVFVIWYGYQNRHRLWGESQSVEQNPGEDSKLFHCLIAGCAKHFLFSCWVMDKFGRGTKTAKIVVIGTEHVRGH